MVCVRASGDTFYLCLQCLDDSPPAALCWGATPGSREEEGVDLGVHGCAGAAWKKHSLRSVSWGDFRGATATTCWGHRSGKKSFIGSYGPLVGAPGRALGSRKPEKGRLIALGVQVGSPDAGKLSYCRKTGRLAWAGLSG